MTFAEIDPPAKNAAPPAGSAPNRAGTAPPPGRTSRTRRLIRRAVVALAAISALVVLLTGGAWAALVAQNLGTPSPTARGTGHDAEWLGHAWVDGRKTQADVDTLIAQLGTTGIRDLFVHAGPFNEDGTLDVSLRPRARWLVRALHTALPGVRVQAWLGARTASGHMDLGMASTRQNILSAVEGVLADGFDGIHYNFEPISDGDPGHLKLLADTRVLTESQHAVLSVSAIRLQPLPGMAKAARLVPGPACMWSEEYLREISQHVDQVALMAYDSALWTESTYGGWVRRQTELALASVPDDVVLFIGIPAYQDDRLTRHDDAETVSAALHGIRLALGRVLTTCCSPSGIRKACGSHVSVWCRTSTRSASRNQMKKGVSTATVPKPPMYPVSAGASIARAPTPSTEQTAARTARTTRGSLERSRRTGTSLGPGSAKMSGRLPGPQQTSTPPSGFTTFGTRTPLGFSRVAPTFKS